MTTVFTEEAHAGEFILSEANGGRSRDSANVSVGQDLLAGTVVMLGGSDTLVAWTGDEITNGLEDEAVGVLIAPIDTSSTGLNAVALAAYISRDAEVNLNLLTYPAGTQARMIQSLALRGIVCR